MNIFSNTRPKAALIAVIMLAVFCFTATSAFAVAKPVMKVASTVLAKDVEKYQASSVPLNETDIFFTNDDQVVMWVKIGDISGAHKLRWEWYAPSGKLYYKTSNYKVNPDAKRRDQSTSWHKIAIRDEKAATLTGQWSVKVFLDNNQIAAKNFELRKTIGLQDIARLPRVRQDRRKWALIIGIERYRKTPPVQFAESDARAFKDYANVRLGVPPENTIILLNDMATKAELEGMIKDRLNGLLNENDTLYVYYAGHGIPSDETPYLLPYDGDPDSPVYTAYPVEALYKDLDKLPAKNVFVFLDTCFSGRTGRQDQDTILLAGARPGVLKVKDPLLLSSKIVVMAAAKSNQLSNYYKEEGHGLFTYYLLKGLIGEADANKDNKIQMRELTKYVEEEVGAASRRLFGLNRQQNPVAMPKPLADKEDVEFAEVVK